MDSTSEEDFTRPPYAPQQNSNLSLPPSFPTPQSILPSQTSNPSSRPNSSSTSTPRLGIFTDSIPATAEETPQVPSLIFPPTNGPPLAKPILSQDAPQIAQNTPEWEAARESVLSHMVTSENVVGPAAIATPETPTPKIARGGTKTGGRRGRGGGPRKPRIKVEEPSTTTGTNLSAIPVVLNARGKPKNRGGRPRGSRAGTSSIRGTPRGGGPVNKGGRPRGSRAGTTASLSIRGTKRKRKNGSINTDDEKDDTSASEEISALPTQSRSGRRITQINTISPLVLEPVEASSSKTTPFTVLKPTPTKTTTTDPLPQTNTSSTKYSPRKKRPPAGTNAVCKNCGRGHSPRSNQIVFCDACNNAWHQYCHDRPITPSVILIESKEWRCAECGILREQRECLEGRVGAGEVLGGGLVERRKKLMELEKELLVSLLLHASSLHPDLPIFRKPPEPAPATTSTTTVAGLENAASAAAGTVAEDEELYETYVEPLPYPKAGNGIVLAPESEDLRFMVDEDVVSFSHSWRLQEAADVRHTGSCWEREPALVGVGA